MVRVVRYHRGLGDVRVGRLLLHAGQSGLRLLLQWFNAECRGNDVGLIFIGEVVGPVGLLVDRDLLAQDLITDLADDVSV